MIKHNFLVCVDPDGNHNKFYEMSLNDDYSIDVRYGRVGASETTHHYYSYEKDYYSLLQSKRNKGYIDVTDSREQTVTQSEFAPIKDEDVKKFIDKMLERQEKTLKASFGDVKNITPKMLQDAKDKYNDIVESYKREQKINPNLSYSYFLESKISEYFAIIPRKTIDVKLLFPKSYSSNDFKTWLDKERDILSNLDSKLNQQNTLSQTVSTSNKQNILEASGIIVESVSYKEEDDIFEKLKGGVSRYLCAYSVTNDKTQDRFNKFLSDNHLKQGKDTTLLWHGSPNKNWWSIATNGLDIKKAHNGMFGQGIYFAPKSTKSMGYMSTGSYWRGGNDNTGYLALFEVATGKSYSPNHTLSGTASSLKDDLNKRGCLSVWAKEKSGFLRNDEVIVYRDEQVTIRYIVEVSANEKNLEHDVVPFKRDDDINLQNAFASPVYKDNAFTSYVDATKLNDTVKSELSKVIGTISNDSKIIFSIDDDNTFSLKKDGKDYVLKEGDERYLSREMKKTFFDSEKEFKSFMEGNVDYNTFTQSLNGEFDYDAI